ncbi:MAG TPA: DUF72 domain-containing protein [Candidatus Nitrosotalea sp.]|nr:DUF72 domain-containing protein [Candidatus Nitrosotalea sp.]
MDVKIGCTGWSYQGWVGPFYPKTMSSTEYLKHYGKTFDITEINSTFYKIPSPHTTTKWFHDTPDDFIFTAKLPKQITHDARLRPGSYLDQFLNTIKHLGSKMKILVMQLPPSLSFTESEQNLDKMIRHLPNDYRYAVEGRHPSWFTEKSYKFLSERNLCLVWNEVQGVLNPAEITTDFVYLRLIGDRSIPEDKFGTIQKDQKESIAKWTKKLDEVKNKVSLAVVMANNHFEGFSPHTANKLRLEMNLKEIFWHGKDQTKLF